MKKLVFVLTFLLLSTTLFGCKSKLEKTFERLNEAESMTMITTMEVPIFGEIEITTKIDGDKEYSKAFVEEYYLSIENGVKYKYSKNTNNQWIKEVYDEEETLEEDVVDPTKFEENWFEKKGDKYILKSSYYDEVFKDEGDEVRLFEMIIDGDEVKINFKVSSDGYIMKGEIIIKDINKTKVTLPEVN